MGTEEVKGCRWFLYMLRCADGSLYTGISLDVERRLAEHRGERGPGRGAKALRGRNPLELVLSVPLRNKSEALKLEYRIKRLNKSDKEKILRGKLDVRSLMKQTE
ncbi:MAG: GIY-YIG nuclease family protein [Pseudomonadales bacterium]|nr:GIY-YIG nuclease family protein [Pseudomonadales bacterium]